MGVQWNSIVNFFIYLGVALPLLVFGIFLFLRTTPYPELKLIAEGDECDPRKQCAAQAAALDLGGKIVGQALVLASAIFHAVSPVDLVIWGVIGAIFQVLIYYFFEFITPFGVIKEIPNGNVAVGIFSAFLSVAAGLLLAALIS